jgi:hypothetical protein
MLASPKRLRGRAFCRKPKWQLFSPELPFLNLYACATLKIVLHMAVHTKRLD